MRIILTDADATDSSDDEGRNTVRRVKRHVTEINLMPSTKSIGDRKRRSVSPDSDVTRRKSLEAFVKDRGVVGLQRFGTRPGKTGVVGYL